MRAPCPTRSPDPGRTQVAAHRSACPEIASMPWPQPGTPYPPRRHARDAARAPWRGPARGVRLAVTAPRPRPGAAARRRRVLHRPPISSTASCDPVLPMIPGHEIVGRVVEPGEGVWTSCRVSAHRRALAGVGPTGIAASAPGHRENLCDAARFTITRSRGLRRIPWPTHATASRLGRAHSALRRDRAAAGAGLIGYRALEWRTRRAASASYGFGAAPTSSPRWRCGGAARQAAFTRQAMAPAGPRFRPPAPAPAGRARATEAPRHPLRTPRWIFAPCRRERLSSLRTGAPRWRVVSVVCAGDHMSNHLPYDILSERCIVRSLF